MAFVDLDQGGPKARLFTLNREGLYLIEGGGITLCE
jgi:hypothetical protein